MKLQPPENPDYFRRIWMIRQSADVRRWHTEPTVRQESVARHSYNVAMILVAVLGAECSRKLLVSALIHDLAERITGDVPATIKWALGSEKLDEVEENVLLRLGFWGVEDGVLSEQEKAYLHAADTLDLAFFCLEEIRRGNREARFIMERIHRRVCNNPEVFDFDPRLKGLYRDVHSTFCLERDNFQSSLLRDVEAITVRQSVGAVDADGVPCLSGDLGSEWDGPGLESEE